MECQAVKCIRQSRDKESIAGFSIERTCPYKNKECPKLREKRSEATAGTKVAVI